MSNMVLAGIQFDFIAPAVAQRSWNLALNDDNCFEIASVLFTMSYCLW
jgi:hypothetical protein